MNEKVCALRRIFSFRFSPGKAYMFNYSKACCGFRVFGIAIVKGWTPIRKLLGIDARFSKTPVWR
jgi:hypothetical protein